MDPLCAYRAMVGSSPRDPAQYQSRLAVIALRTRFRGTGALISRIALVGMDIPARTEGLARPAWQVNSRLKTAQDLANCVLTENIALRQEAPPRHHAPCVLLSHLPERVVVSCPIALATLDTLAQMVWPVLPVSQESTKM